MIRLEPFTGSLCREYDALLVACGRSLPSQAAAWMALLRDVAGGEPYLVSVKEGGKLQGGLPFFLSDDHGGGRVVNSLPFFGSIGGPVLPHGPEPLPEMLDALDVFARSEGCLSATLRLSPFDRSGRDFGTLWQAGYADKRIGQLVRLPAIPEQVVDQCLKPRVRSYYRKGEAGGLSVRQRHDDEFVTWLHKTHRANMERVSGMAKSMVFFERCRKEVERGGCCSMWSAELDGRIVAGLLNSRFAGTVEYLVPAVDHSVPETVSALRPSVYLIANAMMRAVEDGMDWWNFGGTWHSQKGVYQFKRGFGAEDMEYANYTKVYDASVLRESPDRLLRLFPDYYVVPFFALDGRPDSETGQENNRRREEAHGKEE